MCPVYWWQRCCMTGVPLLSSAHGQAFSRRGQAYWGLDSFWTAWLRWVCAAGSYQSPSGYTLSFLWELSSALCALSCFSRGLAGSPRAHGRSRQAAEIFPLDFFLPLMMSFLTVHRGLLLFGLWDCSRNFGSLCCHSEWLEAWARRLSFNQSPWWSRSLRFQMRVC